MKHEGRIGTSKSDGKHTHVHGNMQITRHASSNLAGGFMVIKEISVWEQGYIDKIKAAKDDYDLRNIIAWAWDEGYKACNRENR